MAQKKKTMDDVQQFSPGVGLDVGTMWLCSARSRSGKVVTRPVRDAFLDLDIEAKRSLRLSNVDYIELDNRLIVIGDAALTMANIFQKEARRPLSQGLISAGELDAQQILRILLSQILGDPVTDREHCFYSVPASPLDNPKMNVLYHQEVFRSIIEDLGYEAHPTNEAMAVIFSQCAAEKFSGLGVSFGAGMVNVALSYQASSGMEFALSRGGDWVDSNAAAAVAKTASQMCAIKEKGIDLLKPEGRDQQAIALYLRNLISYSLKNIASEFSKVADKVDLPEPIPFVISGGTSKAGGFLGLFQEEFEKVRKKFPIQISEVRHASDPLAAVAEGLLVLAAEEHDS